MMFPATNQRVVQNTSNCINQSIRNKTHANVEYYSRRGLQAISDRLDELDQEWDIERVIEANASTLSLTGFVLGATVSRKWLILPGIVSAFLLQHSLQGWCPPIPVLRRLGVRTTAEINDERYALKAIRGDFLNVQDTQNHPLRVQNAIAASQQ